MINLDLSHLVAGQQRLPQPDPVAAAHEARHLAASALLGHPTAVQATAIPDVTKGEAGVDLFESCGRQTIEELRAEAAVLTVGTIDDPHVANWPPENLPNVIGAKTADEWQLRVLIDQIAYREHGTPEDHAETRRGTRTIALDPVTGRGVAEHRETQTLERDLAGDAYADRDLVFADALGRPINPKRLSDEFRRLRALAGLTHGSLHTLRHTAITVALCNGIPVHVVAARAGDTPATILGTYAHLLPTSDEQAAEAIAAVLSGVS